MEWKKPAAGYEKKFQINIAIILKKLYNKINPQTREN